MKKYTLVENSLHFGVSEDGEVVRFPYSRIHNINKTAYTTKLHVMVLSTNNSKGYKRIPIKYANGKYVTESVHRLVAKAFIPNPENKPQVNHKDGNKLNNNVSNLEWATNEENAAHAAMNIKKNSRKGSEVGNSKLKEEDVYMIHRLINEGKSLMEIATLTKTGKSNISEIKAGRSWRHLGLFPIQKRKAEKYFKESRYVPTTVETQDLVKCY